MSIFNSKTIANDQNVYLGVSREAIEIEKKPHTVSKRNDSQSLSFIKRPVNGTDKENNDITNILTIYPAVIYPTQIRDNLRKTELVCDDQKRSNVAMHQYK